MIFNKAFPGIVLNVLLLSVANAQVSYDSQEAVYTQSFDSLPSSGSAFTWTDNATVAGWYAAVINGSGMNPAGVTTGTTTTGNLYSFGSSSSADRALGSIGSSNAGNFYWGVKLVNNTGTTITGFTVSYTGEQWRNSAQGAQSLTVSYSLSASNLTASSGYQNVPSLAFTSPVTGGSAGALNGNATGNRTAIGPVTTNNINWSPGAALWIRFYDPDHMPGSDHGLAIDDFSFQATGGAVDQYGPPSNYYDAAAGLTGTALQTALHNIISPHLSVSYANVLAALKVLDEDSSDSGKIRLIYSGSSVLKTDTTWSPEHLWPISRGVNTSGPDYSDLFNLRAVLSSLKTARGSKIFDVSASSDASYSSPAAIGAAVGTSADSDSWQPLDAEKGDIARALFYMDVRYDGAESGTSDLVLENQIGNTADMAVLSTLLSWNDADPVSEEERKRNATIYSSYQYNRNPFVDNPAWVQMIYGDFVRLSGDNDLDGMSNTWETAQGFSNSDPSDANGNADGDGFSNFEEFWMETDPHDIADPITLIVDKKYTGTLQNGTSANPYKTIQGAIDAAHVSEKRAILVKPDTYYECPYITGKANIFLFSTAGASETIIDASGTGTSAVRIYDFQRAAFVGFTVRNASTSWYGAGLRVEALNGAILVAENKVSANISSSTTSGGGGVYLKTAGGSRLVNNFIVGNQAVRGGGVLFGGGNAEFWFNTIADNVATGSSGGGLSALQGVHPDVRNNIIWGNSGGATTSQIHQITGLTSNLIQGAVPGSGNLGAAPLFVGGGDYHITATSPAKNAAVPLPNGKDFDTDQRPKIGGEHKDLGADENGYVNPLPLAWRQQIVDFDPDDVLTNAEQILPDDDFDHDGLSNIAEYETPGLSGSNPDSDWDGISDSEEIAAGTSPTNADEYTPKRIAYFPFDDVSFIGGEDQLPKPLPGMSPAQLVPGFKSNAMQVDEMNQVLAYDWARPNGAPNFSVKRGSVRIWFKLDWSPAPDAMSGHWSRLFDLGGFGYAMVALHFNIDNPILQFFEANEGGGHNFTTWSSFADRGVTKGQWHQVVVTYSPTSQKIYMDGTLLSSSDRWQDGVPVADGAANWNYPPKLVDFIKHGLKFGSDGYQPLRGAMDEVELFNYELTPTQITQNYGAATTLDSDGDGLPDMQETNGTVNGEKDHPAVKLNVEVVVQ